MPELIDKAKLLEYLAAIKPDEYVSAYGEAAVDVINHVETYVSEMPAIEAVDRAAILRLLDEADDIVSALYRQGANKDYKCKSLREKLKAIGKELTGDAGSKTD